MIERNSEEHRHRCEVRWVLALRVRDRDAALRYVEKRGKAFEADVREQWMAGNRGAADDWR